MLLACLSAPSKGQTGGKQEGSYVHMLVYFLLSSSLFTIHCVLSWKIIPPGNGTRCSLNRATVPVDLGIDLVRVHVMLFASPPFHQLRHKPIKWRVFL